MTLYKSLTFHFMILALLLSACPALAGQNTNKFDIMIVPTVDSQLDSWLKIPPELKPTIHMPEKIYPNQPFELRTLFKGYSLSAEKNSDITYDVQFYDPAGKPTPDSGANLLGYKGAVKHENYILTNQQLLQVYFDDSYAIGAYEIKVTARDNIAKTEAVRSTTIELAPFERIANFASPDFFTYWLRTYFRQPDVAKALFGYLQYYEDSPEWRQNNLHLTSFINHLAQDNPWIWKHLSSLYQEELKEREKIIALFALNNQLPPEIAVTFTNDQKQAFARLKKVQKVAQETAAGSVEQISALWGSFYATGHLAPLEKIVRMLKPFALAEAPAVNLATKAPEEFAFWTLIDHGKEIPLVTSYCAYLADHGELIPENKIQLRIALEVIGKALEDKEKQEQTPDKKKPLSLVR